MKTFQGFLFCFALCLAPSVPMAGQSPHSAPHGGPPSEVFADNDQVQVLRFRLAAHATTPLHEMTPRVVVWITDANLQMMAPDGTKTVEHHRAGEAGWVPGGTHAGTNVGDQAIEFIAVVPKPAIQDRGANKE